MIVITHSPDGTSAPPFAARVIPLFLILLLICVAEVTADDSDQPISSFRSRPDLRPPNLTLKLSTPVKLSPGYIFVSPYESDNPGPYIYDNEGNLVWSGWGSSGPGNAHGVHVCQYNGKDHLCFFQGNQQKGYCRGHGIIMDHRYRIVRSVQAGGGISSSDMHEFRPINDGKTALMTIYQQRQYDMSRWNIRTGMAWIMESIFQEVDVETREVLFEWRSLDHVDPTVSYTTPASTDTSGDGLTPLTPWDYFHINSIDKNRQGDYLISSRHTCAIYKISGKDGTVLWQLHGANPSFRNTNFSFSQQHDARWVSENATHTVLSLYNNGYNGFNQTHDYSSGMIIVIDHVARTATQIQEYAPPGRKFLSASQGNFQMLPNGNIFMGWGDKPYVSEHTKDGELVFWAYVAKKVTMNYRAQKFEWDADPADVPALWSYARTANLDSSTTMYVSWNGATKVRAWRFHGSLQPDQAFKELNTVPKSGFETIFTDRHYHPWCYAEALDATGEVLARSTIQYTFVPSPELGDYCADTFCEDAELFGYPGVENGEPTIPLPVLNPPGAPGWDSKEEDDGPWDEPEAASEDSHAGPGSVTWRWLVAIAITGTGGTAWYFLVRPYFQRSRLQRVKDHSSPRPDMLPLGGKAWQRWKNWARDAVFPPKKYVPLSGQPTGRDSDYNDNDDVSVDMNDNRWPIQTRASPAGL